MLSLSLTTGYAIRALCCIHQGRRRLVLAREIAKHTGVPKPYLSKILHSLGQSGLISTKRGYRGGFALSRPAEEISLLDIVTAVEGQRWRPQCLLGLEECSDERACPTHAFWKCERGKIEAELTRLTLSDVADFESRAAKRKTGRSRGGGAPRS